MSTDHTPGYADALAARGYRRVSRKHRMLARVDRPDWREALAEHHSPWDLEAGMRWASRPGMADYYRRVLSKNVISVSEEVMLAVPGSGWDETGYIDVEGG